MEPIAFITVNKSVDFSDKKSREEYAEACVLKAMSYILDSMFAHTNDLSLMSLIADAVYLRNAAPGAKASVKVATDREHDLWHSILSTRLTHTSAQLALVNLKSEVLAKPESEVVEDFYGPGSTLASKVHARALNAVTSLAHYLYDRAYRDWLMEQGRERIVTGTEYDRKRPFGIPVCKRK